MKKSKNEAQSGTEETKIIEQYVDPVLEREKGSTRKRRLFKRILHKKRVVRSGFSMGSFSIVLG